MDEIEDIIKKHKAWRQGEPGGERAILRGFDLNKYDLRKVDLRKVDLCNADLSWAVLRNADMRTAILSEADLSNADLHWANLRDADLRWANLRGADLHEADLRGADLSGADLRRADLSGAKGLQTASAWLAANFEKDEAGYIVYKRIGNTEYRIPQNWKIEPGAFLEEVVNPLPTIACACGVNFGTLDWCNQHYVEADLWRCRIRWQDLPDVVVPYQTDGKARCGRLELVEIVK